VTSPNKFLYFIRKGEFEVSVNKSISGLNEILKTLGWSYNIDIDLPECEYKEARKKSFNIKKNYKVINVFCIYLINLMYMF